MDTNPPPVVTPSPGIFGTKTPSSISFIVALLMFLLPFVEIKCNNMTLKEVTGLQLAVGFKMGGDMNTMDVTQPRDTYEAASEKRSSNKFALIALVLGIAGLVLSYSDARKGGLGGTITGALATVSLFLMVFDIKDKLKQNSRMYSQSTRELEESVRIHVDFGAGFYLAMLAFIAAGYFSYKRWKAKER